QPGSPPASSHHGPVNGWPAGAVRTRAAVPSPGPPPEPLTRPLTRPSIGPSIVPSLGPPIEPSIGPRIALPNHAPIAPAAVAPLVADAGRGGCPGAVAGETGAADKCDRGPTAGQLPECRGKQGGHPRGRRPGVLPHRAEPGRAGLVEQQGHRGVPVRDRRGR